MPKEETRPEPQTAFETAVGILSGKIDLMPEIHKQGMQEIARRLASATGEVPNVSSESANVGGPIEYDAI